MLADVLIAGSGNVTGLNVIKALYEDPTIVVRGYDFCPSQQNPANIFCDNHTVPRASEPGYMEAVSELVKRTCAKYIIASNDHDVRTLAAHSAELRALGVTLNANDENTHVFLDKLKTSEIFSRFKFNTPELLDGPRPVRPFVVRKRLVGTGKKYSYVVTDIDRWDQVPKVLEHPVYTRFVSGEEFTIDVLAHRGMALAIVPRLRREVRAGIVHFGEVVKDDSLRLLVKWMTSNLGFDGMYCVQCIKNADGYHFFEVNPRPGSGIDLSTAAGVNMPKMWIDLQRGKKVEPVEPDWGMKMVRYHSGYFFK